MSTDITLQAAPTGNAQSYDDFARLELEPLARGLALAINDQKVTTRVLGEVTEAAYEKWKRIGFDDQAVQWVYGTAVTAVRRHSPAVTHHHADDDVLAELSFNERAVAVGHYVFDWPLSEVAGLVGLRSDQGASALEHAVERALPLLAPAERPRTDDADDADDTADTADTGDVDHTGDEEDAPHPPSLLRAYLRSRHEAITVDIPASATTKGNVRRKRARTRLGVGIAGLAAVAAAGTFIANTSSQEPIAAAQVQEPTSIPVAAAPPAPTAVASEASTQVIQDTPDQQGDRLELVEPPPDDVRTPHLVTINGQGAFAGVRSPAFRNPRAAVFSTSTDGVDWEFASRWPLNDYEYIKRFEYKEGRFFAWIDNALAPNPPNAIKIGMSSDLINWELLEVPIQDEVPLGLVFAATVADIARSGETTVALVSTDITVDLTTPSDFETSACATSIDAAGDLVVLCSGATPPVLDAAMASEIPEQHRLFLRSPDGPFTPIPSPIQLDSSVRLRVIGGDFVLTNHIGELLAFSIDGAQWTPVAPGLSLTGSAEQVVTIETSSVGVIVGLSANESGASLFRVTGDVTDTTVLADIIGVEPVNYSTTIEWGPAGWVTFIDQDDGQFWLLYSPDGLSWNVIDLPLSNAAGLNTAERNFYVGEELLLIETVLGTGPALTTIELNNEAVG